MRKLLLILALSTACHAQNWSGILDPARAIDWTYAGISGGVPTGWSNCVTSACNTAFSTPTASNINTACSGAPDNTVVRVPAGSVTLSASIHCNRSNVILRGAGPTATTITLNGHNILMGNGSSGQGSLPSGIATTSLTTYTKGATVLTVGSTSGLSAGQMVAITEQNEAWVNATGNEGDELSSWCVSPAAFSGCSTYSASQMAEIASVDSGSQITISAPGLAQAYSSGLTPKVIYWSTSGVYANNGVENMKVDAASSDFGIALIFCNYCWVKNVAVVNTARSGIYSFYSYRDEIRDSYLSASNTAGAPTEYGIELEHSYLSKVENNILFGVTTPIIAETSFGDVYGYNYMLNTSSGDQFPNLDTHRAHDNFQLNEGNVVGTLAWDFIWGSGSQNTAYRNRFSGDDPNKTNYRLPAAVSAYNRYMNVVANVLGTSFHTTYECTNSIPQASNNFIYEIGFFNRCEIGNANYDSTTLTSLMRWGNWDTVTNATRYCTAASTPIAACTGNERANSDPTFPGLASPSSTFPASFYLNSKPAWFGSVAWPAIGPDVTCTTNCISGVASHAAKIPAQLCYDNTAKSSGFLTAFDADVCYAAGGGTTLNGVVAYLRGAIY